MKVGHWKLMEAIITSSMLVKFKHYLSYISNCKINGVCKTKKNWKEVCIHENRWLGDCIHGQITLKNLIRAVERNGIISKVIESTQVLLTHPVWGRCVYRRHNSSKPCCTLHAFSSSVNTPYVPTTGHWLLSRSPPDPTPNIFAKVA